MKQKVLCLLGGPGSAKSTIAAYVSSHLKMHGVSCELITEFAKDMSWECNTVAMSNQVYMFGNQYQRMFRCIGKVDLLVTDSPIIMSPLYNQDPQISRQFESLVLAVNQKFDNINYFVRRVVPFDPVGRIHNETQSDEISNRLKTYLDSLGVDYTELPGNENSARLIISEMLDLFKEKLTAAKKTV